MVQFGKDEKRDWELTLETNTIPAFRRFLAIYPDSVYATESLRRINFLKEEKMWEQTLKQNVLFAYEAYLKEYPSGIYASEAGEKIEQFEDQLAWEEVCKKNTVSAYLEYKSNFPGGTFVKEVEKKITELIRNKSATTTTGETETTAETQTVLSEETALEIATNEDTVSAYNQFLKQFPEGEYADQVRNRINQLEQHLAKQYRAIEEELQAWEYADKQDSLLSYRDFMKHFPEGRFAPLARQRIQNLENKLKNKVVSKPSETLISIEKPRNVKVNKSDILNRDQMERDQQGFRLAVMWGVGFGFLSLAARLLTPGFFPLSMIAALLTGGYFVYQRDKHLTNKEKYIYLTGAGLVVFWVFMEFFQMITKNFPVTIIFSGIFAILVVIVLRHYFHKYQKHEG